MAAKGKVVPWVIIPLALLLLAAMLTAVYLSARSSPRRTIKLPNGSRLTVLGTSLGNQPFTTDKPWQKGLRRWLPANLQSWLPVLYTTPSPRSAGDLPTMASNSLAVWFTYVDAKGTNVTTAEGDWYLWSPPSWPWAFVAPVTADGTRLGLFKAESCCAAQGNRWVWRLCLDCFPRRQHEFELQLLDQSMRLLGSVRVPNPVHGSFPQWISERLPIARTNGPLVVTLQSLTEYPQNAAPFTPLVTLKFRLESPDPVWRQATALNSAGLWSDATGNDRLPLDYHESAWKLELKFRRQIPTNFTESERFFLSGFKSPEPGNLQVLTNEFVRFGVNFKIRCLAGAGLLAITNRGGLCMISALPPNSAANPAPPLIGSLPIPGAVVHTVRSYKPFFLVEATQTEPVDKVLYRVLDSNGKDLQPPPSNRARSSAASGRSPGFMDGFMEVHGPGGISTRTQVLDFDATSKAGAISLEGAVDHPLTFEFMVNPAEVQRLARPAFSAGARY